MNNIQYIFFFYCIVIGQKNSIIYCNIEIHLYYED